MVIITVFVKSIISYLGISSGCVSLNSFYNRAVGNVVLVNVLYWLISHDGTVYPLDVTRSSARIAGGKQEVWKKRRLSIYLTIHVLCALYNKPALF